MRGTADPTTYSSESTFENVVSRTEGKWKPQEAHRKSTWSPKEPCMVTSGAGKSVYERTQWTIWTELESDLGSFEDRSGVVANLLRRA